jgi:hypothetical protein
MICASAMALFGPAAVADQVVIQPTGPGPVIEHRAADEGTTTKTVRHDASGCTTKSVTHSDDDTGSSVTHKKSDC